MSDNNIKYNIKMIISNIISNFGNSIFCGPETVNAFLGSPRETLAASGPQDILPFSSLPVFTILWYYTEEIN
jgi:hypothetical protein